MKRFTNLLKKEIRELVTIQLVLSLAFTVLLFSFIGQVSKKEIKKATGVQKIAALDLDGTEASTGLLQGLESARFEIAQSRARRRPRRSTPPGPTTRSSSSSSPPASATRSGAQPERDRDLFLPEELQPDRGAQPGRRPRRHSAR